MIINDLGSTQEKKNLDIVPWESIREILEAFIEIVDETRDIPKTILEKFSPKLTWRYEDIGTSEVVNKNTSNVPKTHQISNVIGNMKDSMVARK